MGRVVRRTGLPLLLLLAGIGMVVYGAAFRTLPVLVEEEQEYEVLVPGPIMPFGPPGAPQLPPDARPAPGDADNPFQASVPGQAAEDARPDDNPFEPPASDAAAGALPPGMFTKQVTERVLVDEWMPEWLLVRDVTFGGMARLENGQLKRTYSGKPPALCPT